MKRNRLKGVAIVEFSFVMLVLVPLLLGTIGVGLQLVQSIQVDQLARDAGSMYARGLEFWQPGNKTTLATLGADVGLRIDGTGKVVLILSKVTYIDAGMCLTGGYGVDVNGIPINCPNYMQWVFSQRLVVGNAAFRTSNLGSPLTSGAGSVKVDATTGNISLADQVSQAGARATFSATGNPFVTVSATRTSAVLNNLPSGQVLYVTEAAALGFTMPPFANNGMMYAYNVF